MYTLKRHKIALKKNKKMYCMYLLPTKNCTKTEKNSTENLKLLKYTKLYEIMF